MELITTLVCLIIAIGSVIWFLIREHLNYWKRRGIPHDKPKLLVGNMEGVLKTRHFIEPIQELYKKYKGTGPFCGLYFFNRVSALVLDHEIVKNILIKDFNNFVNRGEFFNEKDDPLSAHLFSIEGKKWRQLRTKLTPAFSSGKMKFMFPTVVEVGHRFSKVFSEVVGDGAVVEIKDLNARFTTDVIGTCAFGLECNSLKNPQVEFRIYCTKVFTEYRHPALIMGLIQSFPNIARKLRMKVSNEDVEKFFMGIVKSAVEYREKNNIKRNDFLDILIDLKNQSNESEISIEVIAAQAFLFYVAGFETSSSTISYALYELAKHPDVQDKLRGEINEVLKKYNGEVTYESLQEMQYMEQVIHETLRMYAPLPFLHRVAIEDYHVNNDPKYIIEKGTMVIIPVKPIHYDSEFYKNPYEYDPDRFEKNGANVRESSLYLPFGDGPRNCIGSRFGKMQVRIGLALLIKNFKFKVCDKTKIPLTFDKKNLILQSEGGIFLKVEPV